MFKDLALNNQSKAWKLLKAWGYDEDLYPVEARTFMLTTHSMNLIQMSIEEATLLKDYEDIANKMIIQQYGEEIEREEGKYSLWMKQDEQSYTFQYGVKNLDKVPLQITLDCKKARNMVFSDDN